MLTTLVLLVHVIACVLLIFVILLQTTKGAGMGAAFGGASQTVFGSTGRTTFLTKATIAAAVVFGLTSLGLSFITTESPSVMKDYEAPAPAPAAPPLPGAPIESAPGSQEGAQPAAGLAPAPAAEQKSSGLDLPELSPTPEKAQSEETPAQTPASQAPEKSPGE